MMACGGTEPDVLTDSSSPAPNAKQILYLVSKGSVSTYSAQLSSLTLTPVSETVKLVPSTSITQFVPSPDDHFLYVLWPNSDGLQRLSVFATNSQGVPTPPALQSMNVPSLSQFNIHPSGRFAYLLQIETEPGGYVAKIRLFNVNSRTGKLSESTEIQGSYGPGLIWPAFLYGVSENGKLLFDMSTDISTTTSTAIYRHRSIDLANGTLGPDMTVFRTGGQDSVVLGSKLIIDLNTTSSNPDHNYLNVYSNPAVLGAPTIHCDDAMLAACASATNVQLDPSGKYLFLTNPEAQAVQIAHIDLSAKQVEDTENSIPMPLNTPGFAFNPGASLVYAVLNADDSLHVYGFDATSGTITAWPDPLPVAPGTGFCPAQHH